MTLDFTVEGVPVAQGSMTAGRGRVFHASRNLGAWRDAIAWSAKAAGAELTDAPVRLSLDFTLAAPKRKVREQPAVRPDLDKLTRAVCDALEGVAFVNDGQVVELTARKSYGPSPGLACSLTLLDGQQRG